MLWSELVGLGESFARLSLIMALPIAFAICVAALIETVRIEKTVIPFFSKSISKFWLNPMAMLLAMISPL